MQGTLGIESNAAQPLYLNRPVTVGDVKGYVQAAPTGSGITFTIYVGTTAWLTLTIAGRPDSRGRHAFADQRTVADPGQHGGLDWHHGGGHHFSRFGPLSLHLFVITHGHMEGFKSSAGHSRLDARHIVKEVYNGARYRRGWAR